jgi:glyoxylase-like metal-dependent hydrolase (beta-lactamase superfamily II)
MKFGKFDIDIIDTGVFGLDGGSMFGVVPKAMWAKAYHPGDEMNRIPLSAQPLLVRWEDNIMLIDTGNGDKFSDKFAKIYSLDRERSSIVNALKSFDIKPEDVSHVILTHLHFDHVGGATRLIDGKLVPTFPNAKHYVQKEQLAWSKNPSEKDRASFIKDNYEPLIAEGMLKTVDGEGELMPGVSVYPVFGHTQAMQLVKISDGGETLLYAADLIPTSAHIHVPFVMGYDNLPLNTIAEKKRFLPQAYEENWTIVYEHDAFKQATKIISNERGFSAGVAIKITGKKINASR